MRQKIKVNFLDVLLPTPLSILNKWKCFIFYTPKNDSVCANTELCIETNACKHKF